MLTPQLHQARLNLGNVLSDLDEFDTAIGHYRLLAAANWNLPGTYASLGAALFASDRKAEALRVLEAAVRIAPDSAEASFNLGSAYVRNVNRNRLWTICDTHCASARIFLRRLHSSAQRIGVAATPRLRLPTAGVLRQAGNPRRRSITYWLRSY